MWQGSGPNAVLLAGARRIFETRPFHGARLTECLRRFHGLLANVLIGDVLREKEIRHFLTRNSACVVDGEEKFRVQMSGVPHNISSVGGK